MVKFKRIYEEKIKSWINTKERHPLLIDGARQVGKSYLVEQVIAPKYFNNILKLDFMKDPSLHSIFNGSLSVDNILEEVQLATNQIFNRETDLLFFEEVGLCRNALESLKFFSQDAPDIHLIATGSNIGLFGRFPVGKTVRMTIHQFTFEEFLWATDNELLANYLHKEPNVISELAHDKLMTAFREYLYVGGMPAAIQAWNAPNTNIITRLNNVREKQNNIIDDYIMDFGKFAEDDKVSPMITERIYKSIPVQLSLTHEEKPMPRFKFRDAMNNRKTTYNEVSSPVSFLERLKLVRRIHQIDTVNQKFPLKAMVKESLFKLCLTDIGLLNAMLDIQFTQIRNKDFAFNGFLAEVFVLNEMLSSHTSPHASNIYSYKKGDLEVEYIIQGKDGTPIPIEVKSGNNTKAKSLVALMKKSELKKGYKLTAKNVQVNSNRDIEQWPIYLAKSLYNKLTRF
ncbi:ATP-binding protein [Catenovulum agarivorans]|uniref:ATP-binding protein n=1 Tax=Catenovulum agarivorans TaxID=1172192 RepID=UPI000313CCAF|nr:AAA family ATPase [Catenovulum agarivorans]